MEDTEYIEVVCFVTPDGKPLWCTGDYWDSKSRAVVSDWKKQHPEFDGTPCTCGAVVITMPKKKYIAIGAHYGPGEFVWP